MALVIHSELDFEKPFTFVNFAEGNKKRKEAPSLPNLCLNKGLKGCKGKGLDLGVLDGSSCSKYLLI